MKTIFVFSIALLSIFTLNAQKATFGTAVEYNDYINAQQNCVLTALGQLNQAIDNGTDADAWAAYNNLLLATETSIANAQNLEPFEGGTELHISLNALLKYYYFVFKTEYNRLITLQLNDNRTKAENAELLQISERIATNKIGLDSDFYDAQRSFAQMNGITMPE